MELTSDEARELSRSLIDKYFRTVSYPYTRHHIDSYDQFLQQDLVHIIQSQNPILILKDLIDIEKSLYKYRVEIYVGGKDGTAIEIGTPTVSLQNTDEVRVLYPNEARLRNLTYAASVYADIVVKIAYTSTETGELIDLSPPEDTFRRFHLFKIPIMLHSRFCMLHGKPKEFLREAGECIYDHGGYFIVDGAEKVLVTRQEQAFNTLYITPQNDPTISVYASIECLSSKTQKVKRISFSMMREVEKNRFTSHDTIKVTLPFVRKPIPLFVLFRALGFQSDEEILHLIFPNFESSEAKMLMPKLRASIVDGFPFINSYLAIQYIKTLTKGFSEAHVLDIIRNQLFVHMPNDPTSQALFLGDCVRRILRVNEGYDDKTDRDDTRNQRCLTSGFLIQELFSNSYRLWIRAFILEIGKEYNYNSSVLYKDEKFKNIFQPANESKIFMAGLLNDMIMKGFKGKWGTGLGEEKAGVLQALSRLSYTDFMSHCRRVILDFDTNMKITGPRKLHTSQYGYFCTSETPTGASIGIAKNLSIMTCISTASETDTFFKWLRTRGRTYLPEELTNEQRITFVPVYVNGGMFGYTDYPHELTAVLKLFKRTGCLPYSVSISFSIRDRKVYLFMDAGRPLRPLIWLESTNEKRVVPREKLSSFRTWRDLVMGRLESRRDATFSSTDFVDPFPNESANLLFYIKELAPYTGAIEYIDPYEQNETFIANNPAYLTPETTHMEIHPSTIMSMMTSMIPFAPHNQSPRNQLSCSQSKQGLSVYATNWRNRFDNTAHVLCYGEMPMTRTIYNNYLGEGKMAYGMNCILAIACWSGYNQEDGIVMNYDALQRGMFRSMAYRSYEAREEDDEKANTKVRFGNPANIGSWTSLKPGLDYSKLDDRGIIREGEYVDENTVIVGAYLLNMDVGKISDASTTPQVWTRGRVEKVAIMVNNQGLRLVKIRVVQDRIPELGDKFSNRHGQKGTIGALLRGHDMPRTELGIVPDMIMNPHAIPSRMTIAQNLEQLLGKTAALTGAIGDGTSFMNDGSPQEAIGNILEQVGYEKYGNEILYNGATGEQINAVIFIGPVYGMRLKHMVEDKWQARGKGRKEMRTHQPTGGRGAQGGLKIGEMDRDAIIAHGGMAFVKESFMERSDGDTMYLCTSCGTMPIYNPKMDFAICPMCDGPVRFSGDTVNNLELLPPTGRPKSKVVQVQIPYSTKLLSQEQETFLNLSMRYITTKDVTRLNPIELAGIVSDVKILEPMILPETMVAKMRNQKESEEEEPISIEQLKSIQASMEQQQMKLDVIQEEEEEEKENVPVQNVIVQPMIEQPAVGLPSSVAMAPSSVPMMPIMEPSFVQQGGMQMGGMNFNPVGHIPLIPPVTGAGQEGIMKSTLPHGPSSTIIVGTDQDDFMRDGIGMGGFGLPPRAPRRSFRPSMGNTMGPMMPSSPNPMAGLPASGVPFTITKLE